MGQESEIRQYSVALVGLGSRGLKTWFACLQQSSTLSVSAVCDVNAETVACFISSHPGVPAYCSVGELLQAHKPDFAVVSSPNKSHAQCIAQLSAAGVAILKEKPAAESVADYKDLLRCPTKIGVAFQRRWQPRFVHFRQLLPMIGKPVSLRATLMGKYDPPRNGWRVMDNVGTFEDLGVHMLDIIVWLFGRPSSLLGQRVHDGSIDARDRESHVTMRWDESSLVGYLYVSEVALGKEESLMVRGTKGSLCLTDERIVHRDSQGRQTFQIDFQSRKEDTIQSMCKDFGDYISGVSTAFSTSILQAAETLAASEAIRASFLSNKLEPVIPVCADTINVDVQTNRCIKDQSNGHVNEEANGNHANGHTNGTINGATNGTNGHQTNGKHLNGHGNNGTESNGNCNGHQTNKSNGEIQNQAHGHTINGHETKGQEATAINEAEKDTTGKLTNGNHVYFDNSYNMAQKKFLLNTGDKIPGLGFGTRKPKRPQQVYDAVKTALEVGYRHIDTAFRYNNEDQVGQAVRDSGIPRKSIWITTKVDNSWHHRVAESVELSLAALGLEYIDLLLMHWPSPVCPDDTKKALPDWDFIKTWKDMQRVMETGRVRNIGVSNFGIRNLKKLMAHPECHIVPAVNQIELHPCCPSSGIIEFCRQSGIHCTAYSPLAFGLRELHENPALLELCQAKSKTAQQILINWGLQRGTSVIPKSITPERIASNFALEGSALTPDEHRVLSTLETRCRVYPDDWVPEQAFWEEDN